MSKDSGQITKRPKQFKLGHLGTLNQVIVALGKTIRAMADGCVDSQVGSRIANGLGIMRQCLETRTLDQLGERLEQLESTGGGSYGSTNTISRLTSRIEDLAERSSRGWTTVSGQRRGMSGEAGRFGDRKTDRVQKVERRVPFGCRSGSRSDAD